MEEGPLEAATHKSPQKRWKLLLGGAALAWLLLVHLLVNVWLLLLFSGVMAALGAWLGPRLVLAAPPIHLERFLSLEQSAPRCPDTEEAQLDKEIGATIQKIVRDFVSSWSRRLGPGTAFEDEVGGVMWEVAMELKMRLSQSDREELTRKLLLLAGCHLQCYKWARARVAGLDHLPEHELLLWDAYQELSPAHPALSSNPAGEVEHCRRLVRLLLAELVPRPHLETRTGRHLVTELIACNVVLPLVGRISDPDWINVVLTTIFSKTPLRVDEPEEKKQQPEKPEAPPIPKTLPLGVTTEPAPPPPPQLLLPSPPDTTDWPEAELEATNGAEERADSFSVRYLEPPNTGSPFFLCEESEPESPMSDLYLERPLLNSTEDLLSDCGLDSLSPAQDEDPPLPHPQILIDSSPEQPNPIDSSSIIVTSSPTVPVHPFSFVPLSSPDGPVLIQNLRISGTITAREHSGTGSHPYTLYTIKYDTALDSQSLGTLQPMAYHTVNRRYREFLNLQTRLEERPDLRKFIKHIKGPKKFLPDLPFGNMDSDRVEARKSLLESFLRQLCAVPEIAGSEEVQEFLALNTDARIAFVKKPFLVSRIDKIVVNAIVDTLKTAFPRSEPQSPTEELSESEVDGKSPGDGKKSAKSRLRFPSSKIAPVLSAGDLQERIAYSVREGGLGSDFLSPGDLESFIQKQERILEEASASSQERAVLSGPGPAPSTISPQAAGMDGALSGVALEVLWLLMREQWSWLCTDNLQRVTRLLCGSLIQRWLEVQVWAVTSMQRWTLYLRLLQQAVWPGGSLRSQPRPVRTPEQKEAARDLALQSLMGIIPELMQEVLGPQKCRHVWLSVLDSLQHPQINRHLLYCVWDLVLESLSAPS